MLNVEVYGKSQDAYADQDCPRATSQPPSRFDAVQSVLHLVHSIQNDLGMMAHFDVNVFSHFAFLF